MISTLALSQDNAVGNSFLMPIHSPLVFLCQAEYDTPTPDYLYVDIYDSTDTLLDTYRAIPYRDISSTVREFAFIANEILKGYMGNMDDFLQSTNSLVFCDDLTAIFTIAFRDPDGDAADAEVEIVAMHGACQFGEAPNKVSVYANAAQTYYTTEDRPVYAYFYNDNAANVITVTA